MSVPLAGAFAGENYRLTRRRFYWLSLAATTVVGLLGAMAPRVEELVSGVQDRVAGGDRVNTAANAFVYFSTGAKGAAVVAALFTILAASTSIAGEAQAGTLRLILCRSVKRGVVFTSKFLCLFGFLTVLLALGFLGAVMGAAVVGDFGPVVVVIEKSTLTEMLARTAFACIVSTLGTVAVLGAALVASVLFRAASSASAAALGILVVVMLLTSVLPVARPYFFSSYATGPFDTLRDFALGTDAPRPVWFGIASLQDWADVTFALLVPAASALLLTVVCARTFARKDWLS